MKTTLLTLAANLNYGARELSTAHIGGGDFSPAEQLALAHQIDFWKQLLAQAAAHLEEIEPEWRPKMLIDNIMRELT
jgi:hypothetical protein